MIGRKLAHYEVLEKLGEGGMGEVYLARDTRLGRDVAIKVMPSALAEDPGRRARFEREAQAVAALNHPNVVTIHAVEEADGQLFLVMERVRGVTLTHKIPPGGFGLREFFQLALPLADAVAAAHATGITHRDLKPENVMVDDAGRLKVLDFGLAKLLDDAVDGNDRTIAVQTREGVVLGTAAYMSPEQAEGKPVDARSDVFTLGILVYEMLTGRRPFEGDTHMSTLTSVMRDDPVPVVTVRPELPRDFQRILRRCLEKDPERRYESARGVRYDLEILREEILSAEIGSDRPLATLSGAGAPVSGSGAPVSADPYRPASPGPSGSMPPPVSIPPRPPAGRARWWIAPVILGLVAAVTAVAWWQWPGGPENSGPAATRISDDGPPLVVVFPFDNLGPPEEEYFAAGVTDEITTRLATVRDLRVLSRTSAAQYDRAGKSLEQIAADLGVDYVLEGAVRWQRAGDGPSRVRVTPQLVDVEAGVQVWAEPFDRTMEEIFAVQTEIADKVAQQLGAALGGTADAGTVAERPTDSIDAYHYYLRAYNTITSLGLMTPDEMKTCIGLLDNAVAVDPAFAEAWGVLARAHASMVHFGWDQSEERIELSRQSMQRGMDLDPDNVVVQLGRGYYFYHANKRYADALEAFERAGELQPGNAEIMVAIGYVLRRQDRADEALERFWKAAELSPSDPSMLFDIGETLMLLHRYDEARDVLDEALRQSPEKRRMYYGAAQARLLAGEGESAGDLLDNYPGESGDELESTRLEVALATRDYPAALVVVERFPDAETTQFNVMARELARARVLRAMGVQARVPDAAADAITALADLQEELGDHSNLVSALAVARSLLGPDEARRAIEDARRALQLYPAGQDSWMQTYRIHDLAIVLMNAGEHEEAVGQLRALLERPNMVTSRPLMRMSPVYDPLRDRADFQALLRD